MRRSRGYATTDLSALRLPLVIDNGTGYTKMGFAGNIAPQFIIPSAIATDESIPGLADPKRSTQPASGSAASTLQDLQFHIGTDAIEAQRNMRIFYPVRKGCIENFDLMERYWEHCIFKYLRCDPEQHLFLLTEPPLNPPENREFTAEILFETFNVPGMHIAVQAVLALAASVFGKKRDKRKGKPDEGMSSVVATDSMSTGCVIDSGAGVTHVIPVAEGYVIGSAIKSIPIAGTDITKFVQDILRAREPTIPRHDTQVVARDIKERYCYTTKRMDDEFRTLQSTPASIVKRYRGINTRTQRPFECDIGIEQFMAPEIFFAPELYQDNAPPPLPQLVDDAIQGCPIDYRRGLYANIVLSGGSTLFRNFPKRLQGEVSSTVRKRIVRIEKQYNGRIKFRAPEIQVNSHSHQRYAVWFGGSQLAALSSFHMLCHTREQYAEEGPAIARHNISITK